ncbi:hypothetical protein AWZ03_006777 [Drosophila navojoa]|uniref:Uncharacterized protein n=1 Tax=Drosophila navojoa TaxID=7232 RepID=A0A484BDL7_DRONA|nr:hypothetical protein AWZ03_006777 [Drosophila navojoa]
MTTTLRAQTVPQSRLRSPTEHSKHAKNVTPFTGLNYPPKNRVSNELAVGNSAAQQLSSDTVGIGIDDAAAAAADAAAAAANSDVEATKYSYLLLCLVALANSHWRPFGPKRCIN